MMGHRSLSIACVVLLVCLLDAQEASHAPFKTSNSVPASAPDSGAISNGVYRDAFFGFSDKLTYGWVDRTDDMRENPEQAAPGTTEAPDAHSQSRAKPTVLLAMFERPPEATGETVNSAVVFAAEPVSSYPGLRNAEHYFGPLTDLVRSKQFTVVNEPYEFPVDAKTLMRADFSKPLGKLTMYQSTLVFIQKGYVVSLTFIGGSDDEVNGLVDELSFGVKAKAGQK